MIDPTLIISRLFTLLFVPAMLLAPLLFVLLARTRSQIEADRAAARARSIALALATLAALVLWLACMLTAVNLGQPIFATVAWWLWLLFFPLWFGFAMPALRAKNPAWDSPHATAGPVRTASISSRRQQSPIRAKHWLLAAGLCGGLLILLAARGFAGAFADDAERSRWLIMTLVYAMVLASVFAIQPMALRLALSEPEPLDARGSADLARMYESYRNTKVRGLFWLLAVALPVLLGVTLLAITWTDASGLIIALGAVGGTVIGLIGAWFGVSMSIRRVHIAEMRAKLDAEGTVAGA